MFKNDFPLFILILVFLSCNTNEAKFPYAIKDFRKPMQPYLTTIVSNAVVGYFDNSLRTMSTDADLMQLSYSEHPALRGWALREIT